MFLLDKRQSISTLKRTDQSQILAAYRSKGSGMGATFLVGHADAAVVAAERLLVPMFAQPLPSQTGNNHETPTRATKCSALTESKSLKNPCNLTENSQCLQSVKKNIYDLLVTRNILSLSVWIPIHRCLNLLNSIILAKTLWARVLSGGVWSYPTLVGAPGSCDSLGHNWMNLV